MKLTDQQAKAIFLEKWPETTTRWPVPGNSKMWLRAQPKYKEAKCPRLVSPGAENFKTQPDALWLSLNMRFCDAIVVEVCGTIQNFNDKRSRYLHTASSVLVECPKGWLTETVQGTSRWERAGLEEPTAQLFIPVRAMRVLYALPNENYQSWIKHHVPMGHEFFCAHSSLASVNSPKMVEFLGRMSVSSQLYTAK